MPESFKEQSVSHEDAGVIGEDLPRPRFRWSDYPISPRGLAALCMDCLGIQINVPSTQPLDDLPLDAGSRHEGLHCPLTATESGDQSLSLYTGKPYFTRFVGLSGGYVSDWIVGDGFDFYQIVSEDGESGTIAHPRGAADRQPLQEEGDVPLGESLGPEPLPLRDQASDLAFVLRASIPLVGERTKIYMIERGNEFREPIGFVGYVKLGESSPLEHYELQRFPLEPTLEDSDHCLDRARGLVVGSPTGLASAPLIGEIEAGFPDGAALRSERHTGGESTPSDAPGQERGVRSGGVSVYPERDSNSYADFSAGDFERSGPLFQDNELDASHSTALINGGQPASRKCRPGVPPGMPR